MRPERAVDRVLGHDGDLRELLPAFGEFLPVTWAKAFKAGNGVAGHAFRFGKMAAWHVKTSNVTSCIYEEPSGNNTTYDWILAVPLLLSPDGPAVGVVTYSGRTSQDQNSRRFESLVRYLVQKSTNSGDNTKSQEDFANSHMEAVNLVFWGAVFGAPQHFMDHDCDLAGNVLKAWGLAAPRT